MEWITLSNGVKMPVLGFGVYQIPADICTEVVCQALSAGYRLIDTAQIYRNEEAVGQALQKSSVPREELFLTGKIWIANASYEKAKASIDGTLRKLGTDYLDLMLIHQPFGDYYGSYRAMEEAYRAGKLRAIGVSNFYPDRLIDLWHFVEVKPMVNQAESHILYQQQKAHEIMEQYGVHHQAWAPFAHGRMNFFSIGALREIAHNHGKTAAQVAERFLLEAGRSVVAKTTHRERMAENLDVFDFSLTAQEKESLRSLDGTTSAFFSHTDPETVESLCKRGAEVWQN